MNKTCIQCHLNKFSEDFYKHPTTSDGLSHICKKCQKERSATYQKIHPESKKRYARKQREKTKLLYGKWKKSCSICGKEQFYGTKDILKRAISENWKCSDCRPGRPKLLKVDWKKNCPDCGDEMVYSSKGNLKRSIKSNSRCCHKLSIDVGSKEWFEKYNKKTNSNFKPKKFSDLGV